MMRTGLTACLLLAIAVGGCGASLGSGADAGPGGKGGGAGSAGNGGGGSGGTLGDGGPGGYDAYPNGTFCDRPLADDCSPLPLQTTTADICTLDGGIGFACLPCGQDAGQNCGLRAALVRGARYTYIQILNVDVAFVYAYDQNDKLVAKLEWSANGAVVGQPWTCSAGPAIFDSTEAMSLLPGSSPNELICAR